MQLGSLDELAALFEERARATRDGIKPTTINMCVALLREHAAPGRTRPASCAAASSCQEADDEAWWRNSRPCFTRLKQATKSNVMSGTWDNGRILKAQASAAPSANWFNAALDAVGRADSAFFRWRKRYPKPEGVRKVAQPDPDNTDLRAAIREYCWRGAPRSPSQMGP